MQHRLCYSNTYDVSSELYFEFLFTTKETESQLVNQIHHLVAMQNPTNNNKPSTGSLVINWCFWKGNSERLMQNQLSRVYLITLSM